MHIVLDIGNCGPDYSAIRSLIESNFDAQVLRADKASDALQLLEQQDSVSLITVNRKLDCDYSDGIDVIRQIKEDERFKDIPVMLITNYVEHQDAAVAIGAVRGFGKLQYREPETHSKLAAILT
ncbi:MAG: response regulator [Pirellulaceae bacterium]